VGVHHDHPVFFGQEQIGEPGCAVCLAGGHEYAAVARRELRGWHGCSLSGSSLMSTEIRRVPGGGKKLYGSAAVGVCTMRKSRGVAGGIARTSSALRWRLVHGWVAAGTAEVGTTGWRVNRGT
jgi:hypothetical protein